MGNYDYIISPVSGQPVSKSQFGDTVITAINDLDRRISGFDGSSGAAAASSTSNLVLTSSTVEAAFLTIPSFTFRAGFAYRASMRSGCFGIAGRLANFRLRKATTTGTDYGEYYRTLVSGNSGSWTVSALGTLFLLRTAGTDLTTDIVLTAISSITEAGSMTLIGTAASPRFLVIEPAGFASSYSGLGVAVT